MAEVGRKMFERIAEREMDHNNPTMSGDSEEDDLDVLNNSAKGPDVGVFFYLYNPVRYATILIRLGHEPLPPQLSHTLLSLVGLKTRVLMYPWLGSYLSHMRSTVGLVNLFTTGLGAQWCKTILLRMNSETLASYLVKGSEDSEGNLAPSVDCVMEEASSADFIKKILQMGFIKIFDVVLTQPFHVIAIRQMAAFVGQETHYNWFPQAVASVYKENGISGFFQGIIPRFIGEVGMCAGYYILTRTFRRYVVGLDDDPNSLLMSLWRSSAWLLSSQFSYPMQVVSTVMAVKGSNLEASHYSDFSSWGSCWQYLNAHKQLKRDNGMKLLKPAWVTHGFTSKAQMAQHAIYSLDIHPDGSRLATGGLGDNSGLVVLWNMKPIRCPLAEKDDAVPKKLFQADSHLACVNCVRWSPKGCYLASAGDDAIIMIWFMSSGSGSRATSLFGQNQSFTSSETWRCASHLRGHTGDILDLAWSQNGCHLASASVDNSVRVWTVGKWQEPPSVLSNHVGMVKGVVWDPAGRYLASQTERGVSVWRTSDWTEEKRITKPFTDGAGHTQVLRLSWSPDGSNLVAPQAVNNGFPTAQIIDRSQWNTPMDLVGHKKHVICARYNPNLLKPLDPSLKQSSYICIALGSKDRSISIWTSDIRRPILVVHDMFTSSVMDLAWSSSGLEFMCCSLDGSVAFISFSEADLGRSVSKEELVRIHRKSYGQSFLENDGDFVGGPGGGLILETPEALALQEQQAKMREALNTDASQTRDVKLPAGPPKQIETRTNAGRRRITPKFLGHLDEPDENSNPQFSEDSNSMSLANLQSQLQPQATNSTNTTLTDTTPVANNDPSTGAVTNGNKVNEIEGSTSLAGVIDDVNTTPVKLPTTTDENSSTPVKANDNRKSIEVTLIGSDETCEVVPPCTSGNKSKSPKKSKHRHHDSSLPRSKTKSEDRPRKRKEKHRHRREQEANEAEEEESDILRSKKRRRLQIFQEDADSSPATDRMVDRHDTRTTELACLPVATTTLPNLWLPEADMVGPSGRFSAVCDSDVLIEVTNDLSTAGGCNRLAASRGGQKLWEVPFTYKLNAVVVSGRFICVSDLRSRLHLLTSQGSRVCPPLILDSPLADLHCSANHVLAVTQRANAILWSIFPLKQIMKESLQLVLKDSTSTYKCSYLTKEGMAVIQLNSGSAYGFHLDMDSWIELFDASDAQRSVAARSLIKIPQTGSLAAAQLLSKMSSMTSNMPLASTQLEGPMKRRALQDFLECQVRCSELLLSPDEYKFWITSRARQLIEDGDEYRLRQVCEDLLGPVHRSAQSAWQDKILGLSKRDLLRDLLPLFALNLHLQRLYVELKEQLDSLLILNS